MRACAGEHDWSTDILRQRTMVEPRKKDGKPQVPASAEAICRVIFCNCQPKWDIIVPKQSEDREWKVPKFNKHDQDTWQWWKTKWSDMHSGKVENAGWKPAAFTAYNQHLQAIIKFRKEDSARGWKVYKKCLKWIQTKNQVNKKDNTGSKKRKRAEEAQEARKLFLFLPLLPQRRLLMCPNCFCFQLLFIMTLWKSKRSTAFTVRVLPAKRLICPTTKRKVVRMLNSGLSYP